MFFSVLSRSPHLSSFGKTLVNRSQGPAFSHQGHDLTRAMCRSRDRSRVLEPSERIELSASSLPWKHSTTELRRHGGCGRNRTSEAEAPSLQPGYTNQQCSHPCSCHTMSRSDRDSCSTMDRGLCKQRTTLTRSPASAKRTPGLEPKAGIEPATSRLQGERSSN